MNLPTHDTPAVEGRAEEQTLLALLGAIAHRANDTQLAVACGTSLLGGVAIVLFARGWWRIAVLLFAVACFSLWAIAEHDGSQRTGIRVLKGIAAVAGVLSAFAFALSLLTSALGTWIS